MVAELSVGSAIDRSNLKPSVALCLSGGGYRGMLFSLGTLWRLNELGWLPRIQCISSVSGASIAAGMLAAAWDTLQFDGLGVAGQLMKRVVEPVRRLARVSVDSWSLAGGVLSSIPVGDTVADAFDECLFSGKTLQDLPDEQDGRAPTFVFSALNLHSGERVELSRGCMFDRRVGRIDRPTVRLALAIAGASAFAPLMPPVTVRVKEPSWTPHFASEALRHSKTVALALTDASVCDSLALTAAWRRHRTLFVSDGGGELGGAELLPDVEACSNWFPAAKRVLDSVSAGHRNLCREQLDEAFRLPRNNGAKWRDGAYWSVHEMQDVGIGESGTTETAELAAAEVRLDTLPDTDQERLINVGYAACDAAMHRMASTRARTGSIAAALFGGYRGRRGRVIPTTLGHVGCRLAMSTGIRLRHSDQLRTRSWLKRHSRP